MQAQDASVSSAQADALHEVAKGGDSAEALQVRGLRAFMLDQDGSQE